MAAALRFADEDFELELEERDLDADERELDPERLRALDDDDRLRLADERLPPDRLDPLDFFLPPELPLLRRSAMCSPS